MSTALRRPGPSALLGIPYGESQRAHRVYDRSWRAIRSQDRDWRLHRSKKQLEWLARDAARMAHRLEITREWKRRHPRAVRVYNREYRKTLGMVCHFCDCLGTRQHPLKRIERVTIQGELFVPQKVLCCYRCK